jgi:hypothetical protein
MEFGESFSKKMKIGESFFGKNDGKLAHCYSKIVRRVTIFTHYLNYI